MRSVIIVAGVLVALAGLLFTLQGFGAVSGRRTIQVGDEFLRYVR